MYNINSRKVQWRGDMQVIYILYLLYTYLDLVGPVRSRYLARRQNVFIYCFRNEKHNLNISVMQMIAIGIWS